jgi:hypothetical protein
VLQKQAIQRLQKESTILLLISHILFYKKQPKIVVHNLFMTKMTMVHDRVGNGMWFICNETENTMWFTCDEVNGD